LDLWQPFAAKNDKKKRMIFRSKVHPVSVPFAQRPEEVVVMVQCRQCLQALSG